MPKDVGDWTSSTQANIAPSVSAVKSSAAGQTVVSLPSTGIFSVGDIINVTSGLVTPPLAASTLTFIVSIQADVSITLQSNLNAICSIGDVVTRIAPIGIYGQPIGASARPRGWDVAGFSSPGAGLDAILQFAAVAGKQYVVTMGEGHYVSVVAAADGASFAISGPAGVPKFWKEVSGTEAVIGSTDHVGSASLAITFPVNTLAQVAFETAPQNANNFQSVTGGAYLITGEPV